MNYRAAVLLLAVLGVGYAAGSGIVDIELNTDAVPVDVSGGGGATATAPQGDKNTVAGVRETPTPVAGTTTQTATATSGPPVDVEAVREEFVSLMNTARTRNGSETVTRSSELAEMGDAHAANMAEHDYIGHEQPDGDTIEDRFRANGLLPDCRIYLSADEYYAGAENAAGATLGTPVVADWATGGVYTVKDAEDLAGFLFMQWMTSPGHKRPMLAENTEEIGLGLAFEGGEVYAALEFC